MNAKKILIFLMAFLVWTSAAYAKEPFKVTISLGGYVKPIDNIIRIRGGYFRPFYVNVRNVSESSQKISEGVAGENLSSISFEVIDELNNKNTITKIIYLARSNMQVYQYIPPGGIRKFRIVLDEDEWKNAFKLYKKGARKLRARSVFLNGTKKIYSDYYEIIME